MSAGLSGLFVMTSRGEPIISRFFRDDISLNCAHTFRLSVVSEKHIVAPINVTRDATFFHIKAGTVFFMAASKGNPNASVVFEFLYALVSTFNAYFNNKLTPDVLRSNASTCYELLDEMCDFGFPQITSTDMLQSFIRQEKNIFASEPQLRRTLTQELTGQNNSRPAGIMYKSNDIYIDVVESINLLLSKEGQKLSEDCVGVIKLRSRLSGMPQCKFGFNDNVQLHKAGASRRGANRGGIALDDVTVHQCVKLGAFEKKREIQFCPPDGDFDLMNYRTSSNLKMPFTVNAIVNELGGTQVSYRVRISSQYSPQITATKVVILIPTPENTAQHKVRVKIGKVKYDPTLNCFRWQIKKFTGHRTFDFMGTVTLLSTVEKKTWSRPPISLQFEVPVTSSGLKVRFLRIVETKLGYETVKWVRYLSVAGSYQIRIS